MTSASLIRVAGLLRQMVRLCLPLAKKRILSAFVM